MTGLFSTGQIATRGNQLVDSGGNPQRIAGVVWAGPELGSGIIQYINSTDLDGRTYNYKMMIDCIKVLGFNCIRLETDDAGFVSNTVMMGINQSVNPELHGKTYPQVCRLMMDYAGSVGLRMIVDSHCNAGGTGQQINGLWYGQGPIANTADFINVWKIRANIFKGSAGLLGYDLRNEPLAYGGQCTWGDGGINDIRSMYQIVGDAILAIDTTPLIICEGPQNYHSNFANASRNGTVFGSPEGDLTGVANFPVQLSASNRVVYSVHCYPFSVSGASADTGRWLAMWGYVYQANIAPLYIGECGTTLTAEGDVSWAQTFIRFCNGKDGGITVAAGNQGIGTTWFCWAANQGNKTPFAVTTDLVGGRLQSTAARYIEALAFTGKRSDRPTPHPHGLDTLTPGAGGTLTDNQGNVWSLPMSAVVTLNGSAIPDGGNTGWIVLVKGVAYFQDRSTLSWYTWGGTNFELFAQAPTLTEPTPPWP